MTRLAPAETDDTPSEVEALIDTLLATSERLERLTRGQVDAVTDREGRTFVLRTAQAEMRESDAVRQAGILNALPAHIALLSAKGTIVSVNAAWRRFATRNHLATGSFGVGSNYLAACDAVEGHDADIAFAAAAGIRSVLAGTVPSFGLEYPCPSQGEPLWFRMCVTPLNPGRQDGVVVAHENITLERLAESRVHESEHRFRQIAESILDVFFLHDMVSGEMLYVSPAYEVIWRRSCESLYAEPWSWTSAIHPDDRLGLKEDDIRQHAADGLDLNRNFRIVRGDGTLRWIELRGFPIRNDAGDIVRIAGIATDVSERQAAVGRIAQLNRMHAMLSGINTIMVRARSREDLFAGVCSVAIDAGGFRVAWLGIVDRASMTMVPVAKAGAGVEFLEQLDLSLRPGTTFASGLVARALRDQRPEVSNDLSAAPTVLLSEQHAAAGIRSVAMVPLVVAGESVGVLALYAAEPEFFHEGELKLLGGLALDIGYAIDHNDKRERLDFLSLYDVVTGLANRAHFLERVAQHMRVATRDQHSMALFVIDLERFKNINDSMGHKAGDLLLQEVAQWATRTAGDASLVARVGADRFAVVVPKVADSGSLVHMLEKIIASLVATPFLIQNVPLRVATKVGGAIFPEHGEHAETLFKHAETALKKAKASGDRFRFYSDDMSATIADSLTMENRLRLALDRDEFLLYYQPKINLQSGKITGAEALIRWNDPCTGLVPPGRFIPILEETGLIHEVGRWALRKAVDDHARWRAAGRGAVRIAVNVSPLQLRNADFLADLRQMIASDENAAAGLEVEVTEGLIMEDARSGAANLHAIRAMGICIAIDDFGTGFSSLSYLAKLPVDSLKVDRSFVNDMTSSQEGMVLVSTIIALAHSLKLNVVAEGVETNEQARLLRLLNCDEMQGFLFSKPLPRDEFEAKYLA